MNEDKGIIKPEENTLMDGPIDNTKRPVDNTKSKLASSYMVETFPKVVSNIVFVRRKKSGGGPEILGEYVDETRAKIGSSFKGNSVLRGLTHEEEKRFLRDLLGLSTGSDNWETATKDYWTHISKDVAPSDKDGNGGLKLVASLRYKDQQSYDADMNSEKVNGAIIDPKGEPVNLPDYILWRYCLVYSRVANSVEDIGKSANIDFYLFSKDKEIKDGKVSFEQKKKASQLMYQNIANRDWVEYMLRVLIQGDISSGKAPAYGIRDLATITEDEKDLLIEKYMQANPKAFVIYGEDKNLELRGLIELAVATGALVRIPNTNTISYEGTTIGNTVDEVLIFLNNPKNNSTLGEIRAKTRIRP